MTQPPKKRAPGAGRKPKDVLFARVDMRQPEEVVRAAMEIGGGNISEGFRTAVQIALPIVRDIRAKANTPTKP